MEEWEIYKGSIYYDGPHLCYLFRPQDSVLCFLQVCFSPWEVEDHLSVGYMTGEEVVDFSKSNFLDALLTVGICRTHIEEVYGQNLKYVYKYLSDQGVEWYEESLGK